MILVREYEYEYEYNGTSMTGARTEYSEYSYSTHTVPYEYFVMMT